MFRTFLDIIPNSVGGDTYATVRSVYIAACSQETQVCNPSKGFCTSWTPAERLMRAASDLGLNHMQAATAARLATYLITANMGAIVNGNQDVLLASSYLTGPTASQALPNGQWRIEVEGWFQAVLSLIQFQTNSYSDLPTDALQNQALGIQKPDSKYLKRQCAQQRITAPPNYQNYNVFALVLVFAFGLLVPSTALLLRFCQRRLRDPSKCAYLSYHAEGVLQLHRMAIEAAGHSGWMDGMDGVPHTLAAQMRLPQAEIQYDEKDEPMLRYPQSSTVKKDERPDDYTDESEERQFHLDEVVSKEPLLSESLAIARYVL